MFNLIKTLCELPGPGGDEKSVQDYLSENWHERVESLSLTKVGNLIAKVGGRGPRLLLAAHADELGYIVRHIDDNGFVWISTGQLDTLQKPAMRSMLLPLGFPALVLTATGYVEGIFATLTGHILSEEQRAKTQLDWNDVWVDIGARSRAEVLARGVQVGDRVIWNPPTRRIGDIAYGKAMDDRMLLAIMDRLLDVLDRSKLAYELHYGSTIQEEIGLVGAYSVTDDVRPDLAIALDVGLVGDVPGVDPRHADAKLGGGPMLVHKDSISYNRALTLALGRAAQKANIPIQQAIFARFGSDSGAFIRNGVPAALIAVPTRYTHSPFEMIHLGDVEQMVQWLKAFLETAA
ncbi:MAG: M20/M25/M40 family metallo-hydrolase [Chloroflexi bacterium]|nr:M20/M25/M40 family metallo-hydrolase [Chloroflexota bacterium]